VNVGDDGAVMLSYRAAGARLGVSDRTIRRMVAAGRLPVVRVGASPRVPVAALETLVPEGGTECS
jgi:excisionase family DNA binding protein